MNYWQTVHIALRALRVNALRSALTMLGIVIGVGAVITMIAVGSGGVWKTTNRGTSWNSVFDDQGSYSIGSITIDPNNHSVIWVGTGENVGGRHVGYGDGVYKSLDGGET